MVLFIMVIIMIINQEEEESSQTFKDKFTKEIGRMEKNKAKDFGKVYLVRHIWENGEMEKQMVTECLWIKMVIDMKENLKTDWNMDKEFKDLQMEIFTKDYSKMINLMDMGNTFGSTKAILKEISQMDWDKVKDCGKKKLETLINIKVNIKMTKNGDMESLPGLMAMYLKAIMRQI